mmetsp:Transcript_9176/g.20709  ORF Transcript_9176/g.20709 Transcript_9176/m.20709 type:complete len:256 (+) Transcript_9176:87-854(+)
MGSGGGRCAIKASLVLFFSPILESLVCLTPPPPPPPRLKKKMLLGPTDGQRGLAGGAARACERGGASGAPCGGRQVGNLVGVACARYSGGEAERLLSAGDRRRGVHALRRGSRSRAVGGEGSRRAGFLGGGGRASTRPRLPWNPVLGGVPRAHFERGQAPCPPQGSAQRPGASGHDELELGTGAGRVADRVAGGRGRGAARSTDSRRGASEGLRRGGRKQDALGSALGPDYIGGVGSGRAAVLGRGRFAGPGTGR